MAQGTGQRARAQGTGQRAQSQGHEVVGKVKKGRGRERMRNGEGIGEMGEGA